ncbi:uncharacterized protein KY384_002007 [Bacidia gigantensis]|uniref:uncharacterized protein n=1 Tax=Bacidia gigantensis TaxID=2732470 RepID=UPI001D04128F|nr:uncharacterized protein KY384_002007 [Bacidia gigantensis]KAG8533224.1 hypothetical protein KY384_002007 [Bacidia gigantensis]
MGGDPSNDDVDALPYDNHVSHRDERGSKGPGLNDSVIRLQQDLPIGVSPLLLAWWSQNTRIGLSQGAQATLNIHQIHNSVKDVGIKGSEDLCYATFIQIDCITVAMGITPSTTILPEVWSFVILAQPQRVSRDFGWKKTSDDMNSHGYHWKLGKGSDEIRVLSEPPTHDYNPAGKTVPVLSASSIPGLNTLNQEVACLPSDPSLKSRAPVTSEDCAPIITQMKNLGYGQRTWDLGYDYHWNDFSQSPCVVELGSTGYGVDVFHRDDVIDAAEAVLNACTHSESVDQQGEFVPGHSDCTFGGAVGIVNQASWFVAIFGIGTAAGDDEQSSSGDDEPS